MSLLKRVQVGVDRRGVTLKNPSESLKALFGARSNFSEQNVTAETALGLPAFWRGIRILSDAVGQLPCKVYRPVRPNDETDARETVPRSSRPWKLLHDQPNREMTADEFYALVETHLDLWGNCFLWKERSGDGRIANLWPLNPARVMVGQHVNWDIFYVVDGKSDVPLSNADILHIRGLSSDGVVGYSPIQIARHQLGADMAHQEFRGKFWANDATPGVTLIHPGKLSPEATDRLRALWDGRHKGPNRSRTTAVLAENVALHQMTMPLADAQFIEQGRFSSTQIAHILNIPYYMLAGDNGGNSLTYSTVEGQSVDFLKWSLGPRLVRIAKAFTMDQDIMLTSWFAEFDTAAVLRTTTKERYDAYAVADWMTDNEKRQRENMPSIDGGDVLKPKQGAPVAPTVDKPAVGIGQPKTEPKGLIVASDDQVVRYGS